MSPLQLIFFLPAATASIVTNVLWYRAKSLLRARGFPTSLFTNHSQDLRHLAEVAATGTNLADRESFGILRRRIKRWLFITIACFAGFLIVSIVQMFTKTPR